MSQSHLISSAYKLHDLSPVSGSLVMQHFIPRADHRNVRMLTKYQDYLSPRASAQGKILAGVQACLEQEAKKDTQDEGRP